MPATIYECNIVTHKYPQLITREALIERSAEKPALYQLKRESTSSIFVNKLLIFNGDILVLITRICTITVRFGIKGKSYAQEFTVC